MGNETKSWPPPWELKPASGEPEYTTLVGEGPRMGWDLSFGCRLNVGVDDCVDGHPLTISAHFSDADHTRGFVKREVTPQQLVEFAALLLRVAVECTAADRGERGEGSAFWPDPINWPAEAVRPAASEQPAAPATLAGDGTAGSGATSGPAEAPAGGEDRG